MSAVQPPQAATRPLRPLRILVVDDNEPDVVTVTRLLRRELGPDVTIVEADSAAEALALVAQQSFDVALVDYLLPDCDGLEVLSRLQDSAPQTATLILSGQGNESVAVQAMKRGARDYIVKRDLSGPTLKRIVSQAVDAQKQAAQNKSQLQRLRHDHAELDHFVRSLSHDMNANFMVLEHSFQRLKDAAATEAPAPHLLEGVSHVDACLRESKRFLDDLRLLARTGSVALSPERVELSVVVNQVLYELRDSLSERNVQVSVADDLPAVACHANRTAQIFSNLVRNALRHGCDAVQPRIRIAVAAPPPTDDRSLAWISVHDNGRGIPPESRQEIFLPGRRLAGTQSAGTGMGLAIVKKIVDYYGGRVLVDPRCTLGTSILFSLPTWPPAQVAALAAC